MKTKPAVFFTLSLLALPPAALAQTAYQSEIVSPDQMRQCRSFSDCTLVWSGCEDIAINKQYVSQYKPTTTCWQAKEHNPEAVPTCTDGMCVVVVPEEKK